MARARTLRGVLSVVTFAVLAASTRGAPPPPTAGEVAGLLAQDPVTLHSWPEWSARLRGWLDTRSHATDAAFAAGRDFIRAQARRDGELPELLAGDALAWYLLGRAFLEGATSAATRPRAAARAERAYRRCLRLDGSFAKAHRQLALAILFQEPPVDPHDIRIGRPPDTPRRAEALRELAAARAADPTLPLKFVEAQGAYFQGCYTWAERQFRAALAEDPGNVFNAHGAARALVDDPFGAPPRAARIRSLLDQFPDDGKLVCYLARALDEDEDYRGAARALERARKLGMEPSLELPPDVLKDIQEHGAPGPLDYFLAAMTGLTAFYGALLVLMAAAGLALALRPPRRPLPVRAYALGLTGALALFYGFVPFALTGLLAPMGWLLYFLATLPAVPLWVDLLTVAAGTAVACALLRSLFTAPGPGRTGTARSPEECPRLYAALEEVAGRVGSRPVGTVYLTPGAGVTADLEGRGPFGIFGVRRVLTLGTSALSCLTPGELKDLVARAYARLGHDDAPGSRLVQRLARPIAGTLDAMHASRLRFVNPLYWLLATYHLAYRLFAAGFTRSLDSLADRVAATLYGPEVLASARAKVGGDVLSAANTATPDGRPTEGNSALELLGPAVTSGPTGIIAGPPPPCPSPAPAAGGGV